MDDYLRRNVQHLTERLYKLERDTRTVLKEKDESLAASAKAYESALARIAKLEEALTVLRDNGISGTRKVAAKALENDDE